MVVLSIETFINYNILIILKTKEEWVKPPLYSTNKMITQIKRYGGSLVLLLDPTFLKFHDLKEGDWLDLSDVHKVKKEKQK